ncbi:uncharacterized protein ARMOST_00536 [Armillaria ostoyae]|uniref:Conserved oligomeric Golgi complex subunit 5 n=1 Tax=Armillaria ostoyae TaxID=47428 RepID=A0A284QLF5_ARMOS|nr:uncharacterized protein ARMOST_00536 [Armillaria ostoyae]
MAAPADYSVFASPEFDPNDYANAVLAGEPYVLPSDTRTKPVLPSTKVAETPGKEEISIAISKLTFGIDDVSKQIKALVTHHHQDLLSQAASANELSGSLTSVRAGLADLDHSLEKLRVKIRVPYQSLQTNVSRLQKLQQASDVLRRTSRFVILARRLQIQMAEIESGSSTPDQPSPLIRSKSDESALGQDLEDGKERTIAKAALSIAELVSLLGGPASWVSEENCQSDELESRISLRSVNAIAVYVPYIEDARAKVTSEMENMVLTGLTSLNQSLLASSLQTAYNLRVLPELVQNLILELSQAVDDRIRTAFDLSKISKEILSKDSAPSPTLYKSRVRTEPTNLTAPQWTAALWARLEVMIQDMAECCVKTPRVLPGQQVYTLERVLKIKKDTVSHVVFLDEAMKVKSPPNPYQKPADSLLSLARSLEKNTRDAARSSMFLQQTLSTGYPRLLRLFHEFFSKIAVNTDTTYIHTYQSPETVIVLRALSNFESLYLTRSSTKLNESVSQAFSGGLRTPPGMQEGINIARTVANELDSARFDPLLVKSVAKSATASIDMIVSRLDGSVSRDRSSVTLVGPSATPQQAINGSLATFLYHTWLRLSQLGEEQKEAVFNIIKPSVDNLHAAYERIVNPLLTAIRRELGAIISKMHRFDFGRSADLMAGMGGTSLYMKDLVEKLAYIKTEIFSKFGIGDEKRTWIMSLVQYIIKTFVLHVSIVKPLGEAGKLQLTSDMTELEFALSAFLVESPQEKRGGNLESVGPEYKMLRAMRPLLFLENSQLVLSQYTAGLPPLIVLHHILVRSPIPLPHSLHGWQEAEYVRWVDEHTEEEAWTLVDGGLSHWERTTESEGSEKEDAMQYVNLARKVLAATQPL